MSSFISKIELFSIIAEIQKKKVKNQFLKAKICSCHPVIRIQNLQEDVDEDFMRGYFENKRSGGGKIETIELFLREAVVKFCDPNGKICKR